MQDDSRCKKNKYCGFEIVTDDDKARVDQCLFCGKKVIYVKKNGKIDNNKYLRDHVRDTCQPTGVTKRVYFEVYGEENLRKYKKEVRDIEKSRLTDRDKEYMLKDANKYLTQDYV